MRSIKIAFVLAFVAANIIVKYFGPSGLLFSSFLLIPFDFIARCIIHERLSGLRLFITLLELSIYAAIITCLINFNAFNIALASVCGFLVAQAAAGVFYQAAKIKHRSMFFKVTISDFVGICWDSILFQWVAFAALDLRITAAQILIKFAGGLIWYFIIFKTGFYEKVIERRVTI